MVLTGAIGVLNPKAANKSQCELLFSSLDRPTHALAQIHKKNLAGRPTINSNYREENILDLLITNKPGLI